MLDDLLDEKDKEQDLHADSAYTGEEQDKIIAKYEMIMMTNQIFGLIT